MRLPALAGRRLRIRLGLSSWAAPISLAAGALVTLLAAKPRLADSAAAVARAVGPRVGSAPARLEPYSAFLLVLLCALGGVLLALGLHAFLRRRLSFIPPVLLVAGAEALAFWRTRWLAGAVPVAILAMAPLLFAGRVRPVRTTRYEADASLVCLACEASCVGLGFWFPYSRTAPPFVLTYLMAIPPALTLLLGAWLLRGEARTRLACAGLPALALPFVGLLRNPTLAPTLATLGTCIAVFLLLRRFASPAARVLAWTRRSAIGLAIPAVTLWLILPWRFRDMVTGDSNGHEGQHLGWLNSMSYGKWMMADAGFTYGPLREYALALLAVLQGSLTLEHVRIAHITVNVIGYLCLFAAIRIVCARQIHALLLGAVLLVLHSTVAYWLIYYVNFGTFGWADTARAGLATLAVVVALPADRAALLDARASRRRTFGGGVLTAVAILYSHDFGMPALLATLLGIASTGLVRRDAMTLRARARIVLRDVGVYAAGAAAGLVPFVGAYAAFGHLGKLAHGYAWAIAVSKGATPFSWAGGPFAINEASFSSLAALTSSAGDPRLGTRILDYGVGPALVIAGVGHVASALVSRRLQPRTATIVALSAFQAMIIYYAFVIPDASHTVNGTTPGLVLLAALAVGGRGLGARAGRLSVPVGVVAAALFPVLWLLDGGAMVPLHERLGRLVTHEERPSFGDPYKVELPRAGDEHVDDNLLRMARYIAQHSAPSDPVYCTTWMLGGGAEAFLADRRNPTSFDKADEIASEALQRQMLEELQADPPKLIVGNFFDYLSPEARKFIDQGWHATSEPGVRERNGP